MLTSHINIIYIYTDVVGGKRERRFQSSLIIKKYDAKKGEIFLYVY